MLTVQELVAAEWVSLLRHGVLDADVYPDKATVIIDMLWSATKHASPKVSSMHLVQTDPYITHQYRTHQYSVH